MGPALAEEIARTRRHTIGDLLRRSARRDGERVAIRCGDIERRFAEFDAICNRLANGLRARGVTTGDRIAIVSRNSHAFAALRFALARLGAVLVPINFMLNAEEIVFIPESSGARALAFGPDVAGICAEAAARAPSVALRIALPGEDAAPVGGHGPIFDALLSDDVSEPDLPLDDGMLAQIVYTSGTESAPGAVRLKRGAARETPPGLALASASPGTLAQTSRAVRIRRLTAPKPSAKAPSNQRRNRR